MAVQTVLRQEYWGELQETFADLGERIFHVVLDADEVSLRHRIENGRLELTGRQWRLDHIAKYAAARDWMISGADLVIDTSRLTAQDVADRIAGAIPAELGVGTDS